MTLTTHPGPDAPRPMAPPARSLDALPEAERVPLYRAALGPWGAAHYLPRFAAMDASGRRALGWNWAASLCTLNWLVLRKLWGVALVYVALLEGALLLLWGLGWVWWRVWPRQWLGWPQIPPESSAGISAPRPCSMEWRTSPI